MDEQVKYLLDTNIWLERLLEQERSEEIKNLLDKINTDTIYISDFSLHSIGVIMARLGKMSGFIHFITDLFVNGNIKQLALEPIELEEVVENTTKLKLDFDDSYQYSISLKYDLKIITLDRDFRKIGIKTFEPIEILKLIESK